jgi:hypothetical protein
MVWTSASLVGSLPTFTSLFSTANVDSDDLRNRIDEIENHLQNRKVVRFPISPSLKRARRRAEDTTF